MDRNRVIEHLQALATYYVKDGDSNRARAFERAAEVIRQNPRTQPELLPGVGVGVLIEIAELQQKGTSRRIAKLQRKHGILTGDASVPTPAASPVTAIPPPMDMHIHTRASDGFLTVPDVLARGLRIPLRFVDHAVGFRYPALEPDNIRRWYDSIRKRGFHAAVEVDVLTGGETAIPPPDVPWIAAFHAAPTRNTLARIRAVVDLPYPPESVAHVPESPEILRILRNEGIGIEITERHPVNLEMIRDSGIGYFLGSDAHSTDDLDTYVGGTFSSRALALLDPRLMLLP